MGCLRLQGCAVGQPHGNESIRGGAEPHAKNFREDCRGVPSDCSSRKHVARRKSNLEIGNQLDYHIKTRNGELSFLLTSVFHRGASCA